MSGVVVNIDDINTDFYYCSDCKLYWRLCEDGLTEFRMHVFIPINPKKCPFCSDPSIKLPEEIIEFRKRRTSLLGD